MCDLQGRKDGLCILHFTASNPWYLTLEDDTLMQWCVDNDFCGEAAKAVRYDSDFVWEGDPWSEGAYIISEKDKSAKSLQELAQCGLIKA